jgi:hypothetical protein
MPQQFARPDPPPTPAAATVTAHFALQTGWSAADGWTCRDPAAISRGGVP